MRRPLVRLGMGLGLGLHGLACAAAMRTSMATVMTAASPLVKHTPPSVAERRININKPPLDDRAYRWVRLSNGLEALLVQDESAETAAAALEVRDAGHFSDPSQLPGLAHFVEHMCFLGTETEPEEGAFKAFLQRHGGSSNAFTGMESTGFHFSVGHDALPGALDRFAAFFTCPLMRESSCDREINAIDSEFNRNLQSDVRRLFQLTKSTSSPDHPFSKFSTGNLQTLSATEKPHEAVMGFYREHYLAPKMHLSVIGRESLDELEAHVIRCFAGLRTDPDQEAADAPTREHANGAKDADSHDAAHSAAHSGGPFAPRQRGSLLRATPVRETRMLRLMWELPPEREFLRNKLLRLLSALGGQEGEGSLSWLLTQRLEPPLATSVSCSSLYSLSDATVWGVSITLTPDGLARHEEVARHVYAFIQTLSHTVRDGALPDYLLSERRMMSKLAFDFAEQPEPLPLVKAIASRMYLHEPDTLLSAPYEWDDAIDLDGLQSVLTALTPESALMLLVDPTPIDDAAKEPWYGTPYELAPLPDATLASFAKATPHDELVVVPPPNPYVPDDVSVLAQPSDADATADAAASDGDQRPPNRLTSASDEAALGGRAWHLDAGRFARPRASIVTLLRTPATSAGGAAEGVLAQIGAELMCDQLSTALAPCGLAGLGWSVSAHPGGLLVQASGYSQRLPKLCTDLAHAVAEFKPDPSRFALVREVLERGLRNRNQERPLWHAQNAVTRTLADPSYHFQEALEYVSSDACTADACHEHMRELVAANFVEVFVHGNLLPADATRLAEEWRSILASKPLAADCAPLGVFHLLPPQPDNEDARTAAAEADDWKASRDAPANRLRGVATNPDESNSAIEVYYQFGEPNLREEALLLMLSQIASKSAFHRLRTELQLGYVVQCGVRSVNRCRGLAVLIQSAVADPPSLEAQIEDWLLLFRKETLAQLDQDRFSEYQAAVARNLDEPPKTLHQEAATLWPEILEGTHRWNHARDLAAEVRDLKVAELLTLFDNHIAAGGAQRRKLASHRFSQGDEAKEAGDTPV